MEGQWTGTYRGAINGDVILNLDRRFGGFSGSATILAEEADAPSGTYAVTVQGSGGASGHISGHADALCFFRRQGSYTPIIASDRKVLVDAFPNVSLGPSRSILSGNLNGDTMEIRVAVDATAVATASLTLITREDAFSTVRTVKVTWDEFKTRISEIFRKPSVPAPIFRGQSDRWLLRTAFNRAKRYDVRRFAIEDYTRLRSSITALTDVPAGLTPSETLVVYLGIAQHHGYPTPLIDWTLSPYVAAYFACRDRVLGRSVNPTVFLFDRKQWLLDQQHVLWDIGDPRPGLSFLTPIPARNSRLVPQQSVLVQCSIDSMEECRSNSKMKRAADYMVAFQLTTDAIEILKELQTMGMSATSLFPGLDGLCRGVFEESLELST